MYIYVTQHAVAQHQSKIWNNIRTQQCTQHSLNSQIQYAAMLCTVYCGDQQQTYHRITLHLVQPNPNLVLPSAP